VPREEDYALGVFLHFTSEGEDLLVRAFKIDHVGEVPAANPRELELVGNDIIEPENLAQWQIQNKAFVKGQIGTELLVDQLKESLMLQLDTVFQTFKRLLFGGCEYVLWVAFFIQLGLLLVQLLLAEEFVDGGFWLQIHDVDLVRKQLAEIRFASLWLAGDQNLEWSLVRIRENVF